MEGEIAIPPPLHLLTQAVQIDVPADKDTDSSDTSSRTEETVETNELCTLSAQSENRDHKEEGEKGGNGGKGEIVVEHNKPKFWGTTINHLVNSLETIKTSLFKPLQPEQAQAREARARGSSRAGALIWQFQGAFQGSAQHILPGHEQNQAALPPSPMSMPSSPSPRPPAVTASKAQLHQALLPPKEPGCPKCTLVLDLDETLVHSSFVPLQDIEHQVVEIEVEGRTHKVYVAERPGLDDFLREAGELFELVVFTASMEKYAGPVIDAIDRHKMVKHRLYRGACTCTMGSFVKDLSRLGRDVRQCIIVDNSPIAYRLQRLNAIPCSSWFSCTKDRELSQMMVLLREIADETDVKPGLRKLRRELYRIPAPMPRGVVTN